jgi:hypothetical protein
MEYLKIAIKIALIIMIYIGLERMPYSYYELLRLSIFAGAISLIIIDIFTRFYYFLVLYFITMLLFNPIDKVYFKRHDWQIIDKGTILLLILTLIFDTILIIKKCKNEK